jgi:hypothetical protein
MGMSQYATVDLLREKTWLIDPEDGIETVNFGGIPPPAIPWKGLLGAGLAKSVCKILIADDLGVKISELCL